MAVTPYGSSIPAGNTGTTDYPINNDYAYPRYYEPPWLRTDFSTDPPGSISNGPYRTSGLIRGWIYPIDVNEADFTVLAGVDRSNTSNDALQRAINERDTADAATTTTTTTTDTTTTDPLIAVGVSRSVLTQTYDSTTGRLIPKKIRWREGKQFQFNPFAVDLNVTLQTAAPPETQQQGGTAGTSQVGGATTSLELFFDRTLEVHAATTGRTQIGNQKIDKIFADIGVQKDLWDVYRIILGGDEDYWKIGMKLTNIDDVAGLGMTIRPGGATDMANRLFDLGIGAAAAFGRRVAVFYNPNMVIIGDVTSVGFTYAEFNGNYVPTKAKMDLEIAILSTTSESGANDIVGATDGVTPDGLPAADGTPGIAGASNNDTPAATTHTASNYHAPVSTSSHNGTSVRGYQVTV